MQPLFYKLLLVGVFVLNFLAVYTQNGKIDSLNKLLKFQSDDSNKVKTMLVLCNELWQNDFDSSCGAVATAALSLAEKTNYKQGQGDAFQYMAYVSAGGKKYTEALQNYSAELKIRLEAGDKRKIGITYRRIADLSYFLENYAEGLNNAFTGLKFLETAGSKNDLADCYRTIGFLYYSQDNFSEALHYYNLDLEICRETSYYYNMADALSKIGDIYVKQGKYDEALVKYNGAVAVYRSEYGGYILPNVISGIGDIFKRKAVVSAKKGDAVNAKINYAEALKNYFKSLIMYEQTHYDGGVVFNCIAIADAYIKSGDLAEAQKFTEKAFSIALRSGNKENISEGYRGLIELDSSTGNYKKALEHYKMYALYRDSIVNQEGIKKSLTYRMQYESQKKEAVTKAAQEKKDADAAKAANRQNFMIASLAVLMLAVVIIAFIQFRNSKHRQKANLLLQRQKQKVEITLAELKSAQSQLIQAEKMASLGELTAGIAHEIQNPLNFVNNFSEVNTELIGELRGERRKAEGVRNSHLEDELIGDIEQNMEKIAHHGKRADAIVKGMLQHSRTSTSQKEPTDINKLADEYLRLAYHGLRAKDKSFNAALKTDFDETIGSVHIIPQDIGRVILNLITNAFYAVNERFKAEGGGYEPVVCVQTRKANNKIEIKVGDNGSGIPKNIVDKIFQPFFTTKPTGQGTGLGLSLAYDIVKVHGGELKVETMENEGTTFVIQLPSA